MPQTSGLTVRQHEREGIQLPVDFLVRPQHSAQVHFSPGSSAIGPHAIRGTAVDISSGGMGLECRQFVPRMCEGTVRVFAPDPIGIAGDGSPILDLVFEQLVKVRRVYLISREPMYALGMAFVDPGLDIDERIGALLERVRMIQNAAHAPAGNGADHA